MVDVPTPLNEAERLATLAAYDVLDTPPEHVFDNIVRTASQICGVPVALVSLVDETRQWFKARVGIDASETPRELAFCAHTILSAKPMVVPDARVDERFADNPLVTGEPHIAFYAGAPLVAPDGLCLGTLCVIDREPRELTAAQLETLESLASVVVDSLEFRRVSRSLASALERVKTLESLLSMCSRCKKIQTREEKWVPFEEYLHKQSGTLVSHGLCPQCAGAWTSSAP